MAFLTDLIATQETRRETEEIKVKERLSFLKQTAELKIHNFKKQMEADFYNGQQMKESFSIVGRPIEFLAQYRVNIRSGLDTQIEQAIGDLFNFNKQSLIQALKIMVMGLLKEAFITTEAGEENYEGFFIVPYNNTIVRIDFRGWKYTFRNSGVIGIVENAFCYIVSKSIINYDQLNTEEIIYFLTEACGGAPIDVVQNYIKAVMDIYEYVKSLREGKTKLHNVNLREAYQKDGMSTAAFSKSSDMQLRESLKTISRNHWEEL